LLPSQQKFASSAELSGRQQQRTALARALVKGADLLLLDEPLANLDYKLREDLRSELVQLFASSQATAVYATTEPQEALQLGGETLVLSAGRLVQQGPTLEIFRRPATFEAARAFSDPPLNEIAARVDASANATVLESSSLRRLRVAPHGVESARGWIGRQQRTLSSLTHEGRLLPRTHFIMPTSDSNAQTASIGLTTARPPRFNTWV